MTELLPCPFCGSSAEIERVGDRSRSTIYQCVSCGCSLETGEEWDHGRQWNARSPAPSETPATEQEKCENCFGTGRHGGKFSLNDALCYHCRGTGFVPASPVAQDMRANGWQPIETAPRDGTLILATSTINGNFVVVGWKPADPYADEYLGLESEDHWDNVGSKNAAPSLYYNKNFFTHWQPLPSIRALQQQAGR